MNRIDKKFQELKAARRKAFILYLTAGDPDFKRSVNIISHMENKGVDILELGVPFSDPLADGPTIQKASSRSLKQNALMKSVFNMVEILRKRKNFKLPIVLFTYYNPVMNFGLKKFILRCSQLGVDGILILDLPPEEAEEYKNLAAKKDIKTVFLVSPTSPAGRIKKIAEASTGFIYCVSRTGVTGARKKLNTETPKLVKQIKRYSTLPVAVGFGISTPRQIREVAAYADAAVVGSAAVKKIEENLRKRNLEEKVVRFVSKLAAGLKNK